MSQDILILIIVVVIAGPVLFVLGWVVNDMEKRIAEMKRRMEEE